MSKIKFRCVGCEYCDTPCEVLLDPDNVMEVPDGCIRSQVSYTKRWARIQEAEAEVWIDEATEKGYLEYTPKEENEAWDENDWLFAIDFGVIIRSMSGILRDTIFLNPTLAISPESGKIFVQGLDPEKVEVSFSGKNGPWQKPLGDVMAAAGADEDEDNDGEEWKQ